MVRLVFLGRLTDLAGGGELQRPAGTLTAVLAQLPAELALALNDERVRWAINGALVARDPELVLNDGDELAFLPPVSGG